MPTTQHLALAVLLLGTASGAAQEASPSGGKDGQPYTLHVYTNRMQVAALVLNQDRRNLEGVTADKFKVSIDDGPRFHPTRTRVEGDDPVSLAILLDEANTNPMLLKAVVAELPGFAESALHPADDLSLYAADCKLIRSASQASATREAMAKGLATAFAAPELHQPNGHHCGGKIKLRDDMALILARMRDAPGRRVLLVISPGIDSSSTISTEKLAVLAARQGAAVFSIRMTTADVSNLLLRNTLSAVRSGERGNLPMLPITATNGGLIFSIDPDWTRDTLERFAQLLRTRYIVEFPVPDKAGDGFHHIELEVPKAVQVLSTGNNWTSLSASVKSDPSTILGAPSPAVIGNNRPKSPK